MEKTDIPEGMDLIADIVSANVSNLAATTDRLIANLESEILSLAKLVVEIDEVLDSATVIDRKTEGRLRALAPQIDNAYNTSMRMREGN